MRSALAACLLLAAPAAAQTIHLGETERWFLALSALQEARGCIPADDALRPGLEALIRETNGQAMRAIDNDFERGLLAGRLAEHAAAQLPATPEDARCRDILAGVARHLIRLRVR
jgi:hypothetical protein